MNFFKKLIKHIKGYIYKIYYIYNGINPVYKYSLCLDMRKRKSVRRLHNWLTVSYDKNKVTNKSKNAERIFQKEGREIFLRWLKVNGYYSFVITRMDEKRCLNNISDDDLLDYFLNESNYFNSESLRRIPRDINYSIIYVGYIFKHLENLKGINDLLTIRQIRAKWFSFMNELGVGSLFF